LETHNVLYMCQYGFRNRHSVAQEMTGLVIDNIKARENNQHAHATHLDLSKAFDTIDHKVLINKFEYYGVLLFLIYTNDLPLSLTYTKAILFADDTALHASSKQLDALNHKINNDLDCLCDWFEANKLSLILPKPITCFSRMGMIIQAMA